MYKSATNYKKTLLIKALNLLGLFNISILLLRFLFKLYSANPTELLPEIVYALSTPLVIFYQPFVKEVNLIGSSILEPAALIGLVVTMVGTYLLNFGLTVMLTREGKYPYSSHMRILKSLSKSFRSRQTYQALSPS